MSQKKKVSKGNSSTKINDKGIDKFVFIALTLLGVGILICLVINLLWGPEKFDNKISDTYVTAILQNYYFIIGAICLIPVIWYIYKYKISELLKRRFISDSLMLKLGFFGFIILMIAVISVCSIVYPINKSTLYGNNSKITVGFFLIPSVIFVFEVVLWGVLRIPELIKEKQFWKTVRRNAPIILIVMFIIWTFISCMLAPSAVDKELGDKTIVTVMNRTTDINGRPYTMDDARASVLAKTLNGCYNLKDGFWAFLMYGSVMLVAMVLGKGKTTQKKYLIKIFIISILVLSLITIILTAIGNSNLYSSWNVFPKRSIFRNSNHFAYVLCVAVIASAVLATIEKNIFERILYLVSFGVLTYMLIVNDTFGGYLGVAVSLFLFTIYVFGKVLIKTLELHDDKIVLLLFSIIIIDVVGVVLCKMYCTPLFLDYLNNNVIDILSWVYIWLLVDILTLAIYLLIKKQGATALVCCLFLLTIITTFTVLSKNLKDSKGDNYAQRNFTTFFDDAKALGNFTEESSKAYDEESYNESVSEIKEIGSGRGKVWVRSLDLIKQRPLFGYGLECLLFQFSGQFEVNEGRTHNLLLQLLATIGIPGTVMYFTALGIILVRLLKNWKHWDDVQKICVFVGITYIISSLTGNSTYYSSPYFMMFLGFVVLAPWKKEEYIEQ